MQLLIVRHGDPDYERDTLTPAGQLEAEMLAGRLEKVGPTHLFASPMGRAQATALPTARRCGQDVVTLSWAAELTGLPRVTEASGCDRPVWDAPGERIRSGGPRPWGSVTGGDYEGRLAELAAASDTFMATLGYHRDGGVYRVGGPDEAVVVVFCHAGFGLSWLAHLLDLPTPLTWCGFYLAPTSVTTVLMERRSDGLAVPRAIAVGDASHVTAAGLPANHRGLSANTH